MLKRLILVELHAGVQISNKELAVKSKLLNMLRRIQDFEKGGSNKWAAKGGPIWGWSGGMLPLEILKFKSSEMRFPALWGMMVDDLRTSLCKNQTSWEIKKYKNVAKKEWNVYFSIPSWIQHYKLALVPCIVTSFIFTLIYSIFPGSECEHTNRLFISVQSRSFLLSNKIEFLQKYTDSGTETTHLAGYNTLVFKYVQISAGLPPLFIGAIRGKSSKSDIT